MAKKKFPRELKIALIILLVIAILIPLAVIAVVSLPWAIVYFGTLLYPAPPALEPQITYHEFPFHIEYMINGERIVIDNALICEYEGSEILWIGSTYVRSWKLEFKQYDVAVTPLDDIVLYCDDNIIIYYAFGSASYYMGDKDNPSRYLPSFRINDMINGDQKNNYAKDSYSIDQEKLLDYGIEIIDFVPPEPIENTFE